jgi:DNA-binding beta-propeller fold protein YncE
MKSLISVQLLLIIFIGCSSENEYLTVSPEIEITVIDTILTVQKHDFIASPLFLAADNANIYTFDRRLNAVQIFDHNGSLKNSFGRQGRGPGEFMLGAGVWAINDTIIVNDQGLSRVSFFSLEGELLKSISVERGFFSGFLLPATTGYIFEPVNAENNALAKGYNLQTNELTYFGEANAEPLGVMDFEATRRSFRAGEIPDMMKNHVTLFSENQSLYLFQQAYGILEKYDMSGNLIWNKEFLLPEMELIYNHIAERNLEAETPSIILEYVSGITTIDNGIALMLSTRDLTSPVLIWVSNDGQNQRIIRFPSLEMNPNRIAATPDGSYLFLLNSTEAEVYRVEWPY